MDELLIITGSMGAGKSAVLAEAGDILALRHISYAAIDVDSLGLVHLPSAARTDTVMYENLRVVCTNYSGVGVRRFLFARALESREELELCRQAVPGARTAICRLAASIDTMRQRVTARESGILQPEFVARVAELSATLDRVRLEDFVVENENRSLTEVALEVLVRAGWILS